jgi:succinate dehydrogenase / fumarate reductase iron-sulfur subunit
MPRNLNLKIKVWRQNDSQSKGAFKTYELKEISTEMSFLEMLDVLNQQLIKGGEEAIAFDHDCREGICGACGATVNGSAHGPEKATTLCQLHMRAFDDGDLIVIEPFRAKAFPVVKDLVVDRSAFDRMVAAGGFITANTGSAPDANSTRIPKPNADISMDAAACIGCGACVASCKNAAASLFVGAKVTHLGMLPQGDPERESRVQSMVAQMDAEGFGHCTNTGSCTKACPKEIPLDVIARLNRELARAVFTYKAGKGN